MDRFFGSNIKINLLVQNITFLRFLICKCQPHMFFLRALMKELLMFFMINRKSVKKIFIFHPIEIKIVLHSAVSNSHVLFFCKHFHLIEYLCLTVLLLDFIADLEFVWSNVRF